MEKAAPLPDMKGPVMKMCGTAFLWLGLAGAFFAPTAGGKMGVLAGTVGFLCFAAGLGLFSEGMKREIVAELRAPKRG